MFRTQTFQNNYLLIPSPFINTVADVHVPMNYYGPLGTSKVFLASLI